MIRVVRRGPRADQGGRRYWLSNRSIAYEMQIGVVHFHWTPANPAGRVWAHIGRVGGWIGGGEWLSDLAFSAACRVWYDAHHPNR